jgi:drug/metabolite transporter (DMT)-like permease
MSISMQGSLFWLVLALVIVTDHSTRSHAFQSISPLVHPQRVSTIITNTRQLSTTPSLGALDSRGGAQDVGHRGDNPNNDNNNDNATPDTVLRGRGLLCVVALLYGTLNVSLRLVYQLPDPPSAAALSATRGWLASLCFLPLLAAAKQTPNKRDDIDGATTRTTSDDDELLLSPSTTTTIGSSALVWAGLELAVWNFLAQGLLTVGLVSTGSARASFLTQTSVVLTPMIALLAGQSVPSRVWKGCGIALVGLTLLSGAGGGDGGGLLALAFSSGDGMVLGGALSWSLYLFRLSQIGSKFDEINLQSVKTFALAILYSVWFFVSGGMSTTMGWTTHLVAWGALCYSALGPGMLADVLQQQGQKYVSASEANVILSMEPVFAALCATLLLGEVTTLPETIGGGLILLAAVVATR